MPSASASAAVAICTPASNWLTIFTVLPMPDRVAQAPDLAGDRVQHRLRGLGEGGLGPRPHYGHRAFAMRARPRRRTPAHPASTTPRLRRCDGPTSGARVFGRDRGAAQHHGAGRQPCHGSPRRPNSTSSVCAAFTTKTTTASQIGGQRVRRGPRLCRPRPRIRRALAAARGSQPDTAYGPCAQQVERQRPCPSNPSPITPTFMLFIPRLALSLTAGGGTARRR